MGFQYEQKRVDDLPEVDLANFQLESQDIYEFVLMTVFLIILSKIVMKIAPTPDNYQTASGNFTAIEKAKDNVVEQEKVREDIIKYNYQIMTVCQAFTFCSMGTWYVINYGVTTDNISLRAELRIITVVVSWFLVDILFNFYYGFNYHQTVIHHLLGMTGAVVPFIYKRFGSFVVFNQFSAEVSNPWLQVDFLLPYLSDISIANSFLYILRGKVTSDIQVQKRAFFIRHFFKCTFAFIFIIVRSYFVFSVYAIVWGTKLPLFYKIATAGVIFLHFFWAWEVLNMTAKTFAQQLFPSNKIFAKFYDIAKNLRPYRWIYVLLMMLYLGRPMLEYFDIKIFT